MHLIGEATAGRLLSGGSVDLGFDMKKGRRSVLYGPMGL